ncbi:DUF4199 domain-containing protein [Segatella albensis]|jgi:hypothetical protein|nr:DUF4199 domain-containing protein [Segatella albensis]
MKQLAGFARQFGTFTGLTWIVSFLLGVYGIGNGLMQLAGVAVGLFSLYAITIYVKYLRTQVIEHPMNFSSIYGYVTLIFFYGSLLMAAAVWVYFAFFDHGQLLISFIDFISLPQNTKALADSGISAKKFIDVYSQAFAQYGPLDFAIEIMSTNIIIGIIFGIPVALWFKNR